MVKDLVSIVIPSRNEKYLLKTIQDILKKASGNIEVIVILEGYWPNVEELINDSRVVYIHFPQAKGMRRAINSAVSISKGEYILKVDAHCMFDDGFDHKLKIGCEDDYVVVPRRYSLEPETWSRKEKNPIDYMYLSPELHGKEWRDHHESINSNEPRVCDSDSHSANCKFYSDNNLDDLMSFQGSCWFMKRSYYDFLELMDEENYGAFWYEAQEIGLKCWLSGGRVIVNKNTWYAHFHKPREEGRGYSLDKSDKEKVRAFMEKWLVGKDVWHKQHESISWLIKKFAPVPEWNNYEK